MVSGLVRYYANHIVGVPQVAELGGLLKEWTDTVSNQSLGQSVLVLDVLTSVPVDHSPYTCLLFSNEDKEKEKEERRYEILLLSTKWPTNRHVLCCAC